MQDKKELRLQKLQMIDQWQQSGLSQKAFCAANGIAYHVFHYWYGVYRADKNTSGSFLALQIQHPKTDQQIMVTGVNGIRVQFPFSDQAVCFVKQLLS
ncbi:hypothetical protein BH11BAC5_BH11BAC5_47470 [soil metagenome]